MRGKFLRGRARLALLCAALVGAAGGAAYATIPDATGAPPVLSSAFTSTGTQFLVMSNYTTVVELNLPAGNFVLTGKGLLANQQSTDTDVACNMIQSPGSAFLDTSDETLRAPVTTNENATIAFNATVSLSAPANIRIECISANVDGIPATLRLTATTVGAITVQ